jgi:hypothetical protein
MSRLTIAAVAVVALAALAGGAFGVVELNEHADRDRAMYHDTLLMAGLQYDLLNEGKPGIELAVDSTSPPVRVGEEIFQANEGVEVVVEERDGSWCVQGRNQYGDETEWQCVDGTGTRPSMGALEGEHY